MGPIMKQKPTQSEYWKTATDHTGSPDDLVSGVYGFGILLVEPLNEWHVFGFPVGFWFAHQGSIIVFISLILPIAF